MSGCYGIRILFRTDTLSWLRLGTSIRCWYSVITSAPPRSPLQPAGRGQVGPRPPTSILQLQVQVGQHTSDIHTYMLRIHSLSSLAACFRDIAKGSEEEHQSTLPGCRHPYHSPLSQAQPGRISNKSVTRRACRNSRRRKHSSELIAEDRNARAPKRHGRVQLRSSPAQSQAVSDARLRSWKLHPWPSNRQSRHTDRNSQPVPRPATGLPKAARSQ